MKTIIKTLVYIPLLYFTQINWVFAMASERFWGQFSKRELPEIEMSIFGYIDLIIYHILFILFLLYIIKTNNILKKDIKLFSIIWFIWSMILITSKNWWYFYNWYYILYLYFWIIVFDIIFTMYKKIKKNSVASK